MSQTRIAHVHHLTHNHRADETVIYDRLLSRIDPPPLPPTPEIERGRGEGGGDFTSTPTLSPQATFPPLACLRNERRDVEKRLCMKCKLSALGTSTLLIEIWMNTTRVLVSSKPVQPITIKITNYAATYSWRKLLRLNSPFRHHHATCKSCSSSSAENIAI